MKTNVRFWPYLAEFSLEWHVFSYENYIENQNTYLSNNFFFFQNCAVYEIMWENIVEPDRAQMTIRRTLIACFPPPLDFPTFAARYL